MMEKITDLGAPQTVALIIQLNYRKEGNENKER